MLTYRYQTYSYQYITDFHASEYIKSLNVSYSMKIINTYNQHNCFSIYSFFTVFPVLTGIINYDNKTSKCKIVKVHLSFA